jgi:ABC-type phosphate transport system substrate-binding protein
MLACLSMFLMLQAAASAVQSDVAQTPAVDIEVRGTGASFPALVYQDLIFAYQFVKPNVKLSYLSTGSSAGKCRIQVRSPSGSPALQSCPLQRTLVCTAGTAIWKISAEHSTNDHICAVQEFAKVCNTATDKSGMEQIDFAGSDSLVTAKEYTAYPDLQMFPAVFGLPHVESHLMYSMQCSANHGGSAICELAASGKIDEV